MKKFLCLGLACLLTSAVYADSYRQLNRVNVVIFTQSSNTQEQWTHPYQAMDVQNTVDLTAADTTPAPYQTLPVLLPRAVAYAQQQGHVLLATSWLQPDIEDTHWVHLTGGTAYDATNLPIHDSSTPAVFWELNGKIRVSTDGPRTVSVNVCLNLPNGQQAVPAGFANFNSECIQQSVQITRGKPVYFDHPLFGMIVMVTHD